MLYHVSGGAVRERLAGLPCVIRYVLVDEVDVARRREGVGVLPVGIVGRLGHFPVRRHAVLEIVPRSMLNTLGRLPVLVLQGAVAAARVVGRTGFFATPVASVRVLQGGISGCRMAAAVTAVAARLLNVYLLASITVVVLRRRIWHRL